MTTVKAERLALHAIQSNVAQRNAHVRLRTEEVISEPQHELVDRVPQQHARPIARSQQFIKRPWNHLVCKGEDEGEGEGSWTQNLLAGRSSAA